MTRAALALSWMFLGLVGCGASCGTHRKEGPDGGPSDGGAPGTDVQRGTSSPEFFLALGAVHERFRDPTAAVAHYETALARATAPRLRGEARRNLARLSETRGDRATAIEQLEAARHELAGESGSTTAQPAGDLQGPLGDVSRGLARLYTAQNRFDDAEQLYRSLSKSDPWQREELARLLLGLWKEAGTLPRHVSEAEAALKADAGSEESLLVLALAYGGGGAGLGLLPPGWAPGGPTGAELDRLTEVYERLSQLHPSDGRLRPALVSLYEKQGRLDDCVRLLRAQAAPVANPVPSSGAPIDVCAYGIMPKAVPTSIATEAEVVRVLARGGRRPEALDLTTQLPSKADKDPDVRVVAHVVAAQLFLEQGAPDRAEATFRQASSAAVTLDDRRQLAVGRGDLLFRARRFDELRALLSQWRAGDDACLRTEAARREAMLTPLR